MRTAEIIRKTAGVPQVSDRFHGRKIYSMLYKSKYNNITIKYSYSSVCPEFSKLSTDNAQTTCRCF